MESWYFELLGGVRIHPTSGQRHDLVGKKPGAVLALLALSPGKMRSREEVIDLIWPEVELEDARNRFRVVLFELRKLLEPPGTPSGSVLFTDRTQVGIAAGHTSDVAEFEGLLRQAATTTEPVARAQHLQAALALFQGEFAPGFYLDVLLTERERLNALAHSARERLRALESTAAAVETTTAATTPPPLPPAPTPRNRFFGRVTELERLHSLLTESRLVTLLGPGGTGKTRLVQELGAQLPSARFVPLATLHSGEGLLDTLVSALELPSSNEPSLTRLQRALADNPPLLILDNLEQLVESGGPEAIASLLEAAPHLSLLVTSRTRLSLADERVYTLGTLDVPLAMGTPERLLEFPAVALFVDRAQIARPSFELTSENAGAVAELCRHLDGLPLAIELAAARITVLSPQQILERLSRRFDLLADKRRDRDQRHTSLRATLDWSWNLLSPDMQQFFAQLSVFRGSFSLDAVEAVTEEFLALDYLQSLVDASLVVVESEGQETRFRLLETLREYGQEKLERDRSEALRKAHFDYYFDRVRTWRPLLNGAEISSGIAYYKQEKENILAALDRALVAAPADGVELCLTVAYFWQCVYWNRPAIQYLRQAIQAVEKHQLSETLLNRLHTITGYAYMRVKEYATARTFYQRAYDYKVAALEQLRQEEGSAEEQLTLQRSIAGLLHNLGILFFQDRHFSDSQQHFLQAQSLNQTIGNDSWQARNIDCLGHLFMQQGLETEDAEQRGRLFETALDYFEDSITLCERAQDEIQLCHSLRNKAYLFQLQGRFYEVTALLQRGFGIACTLEQWGEVMGFLNIYYHQALQEQLWEEATQFQGSMAGLSQRWETESYLPEDSHLRPSINLVAHVGVERYQQLHDTGASASLPSLQILAARFHEQTLPHVPAEK